MLVELENFEFKTGGIVDPAQNIIRRTKYAVEEVKLVLQQFIHAQVRRIALVQEVDDHHIMLLPVSVAASDALLDALGIPGKIEVDDHRAKLKIDSLGPGFRGDHDLGFATETVDQGMAQHHGFAASRVHVAVVSVLRHILFIDLFGIGIAFAAAGETDDIPCIAIGFKESAQVFHGATGLREHHDLLLCPKLPHFRPTGIQRLQKMRCLGVGAHSTRPVDEPVKLVDFGLEFPTVKYGWGLVVGRSIQVAITGEFFFGDFHELFNILVKSFFFQQAIGGGRERGIRSVLQHGN